MVRCSHSVHVARAFVADYNPNPKAMLNTITISYYDTLFVNLNYVYTGYSYSSIQFNDLHKSRCQSRPLQ